MRYVQYRVPAALEQIQCILAIPTKKSETRLIHYLTLDEVQAILDAPDPSTREGLRDRAMLHVCFAAGLRVSELVEIQLTDLVLGPKATVLVHGKDRRERVLPFWKEVARALRAWLAVRGEYASLLDKWVHRSAPAASQGYPNDSRSALFGSGFAGLGHCGDGTTESIG